MAPIFHLPSHPPPILPKFFAESSKRSKEHKRRISKEASVYRRMAGWSKQRLDACVAEKRS
ncbi:uncharacterized protein MYCFIDRAFT_183336 [Pseudocercospora fijiensis CIRAD86]|uniref:Uncharacterized protein n=1 Tax=Pseudocercospora fijiensis (strain CIRAD86) TaxID=383855 RepID=M3AA09_PSEFD|nr:uncharacterized protein MYCFIDRAFT_183336 [Pseudocercospora fijiensis CIRAD86]EME81466.1 hypothetical protein MYCFIDRAFT_183336 [Pseudocercospora fijiensis CIRAD86]